MIQFIYFVQAVPAMSHHHQPLLTVRRGFNPPPSSLSREEQILRLRLCVSAEVPFCHLATAPPVALTLWYPQGIKALG